MNTLYTQSLILTRPQEEDFQKFYEIYADPQTNLFNPAGPLSLENAKERFPRFPAHWVNHGFGNWTIRSKDTNEIIGFGGLSNHPYGDELRLNVGYRFAESAWGKGYATEICRFSIDYAFNEVKADKVFALVRPDHAASIRVLEKCGMKLFETLDDVPGKEHSLVFIIFNQSEDQRAQ